MKNIITHPSSDQPLIQSHHQSAMDFPQKNDAPRQKTKKEPPPNQVNKRKSSHSTKKKGAPELHMRLWNEFCKKPPFIVPSANYSSNANYNDHLSEYLSRLSSLRPLTDNEQQYLCQKVFEERDQHAEQVLIITNLRLVVKIAREYARPHAEFFELIQEGNVGLAISIGRFDPSRGVKFISYAQYWIRALVLNFLMNHSYPVKFGNTRAGRKLFYNLKKARTDLREKGIDKPSPIQVAEYLGVDVDEVIRVSAQMDAPPVQIDSLAPGYDGVTNGELMASPLPYPDTYAERNELASLLNNAFEDFNKELTEERDRSIWHERMISDNGMTLKQLGSKWGVSKERIRQVETEIRDRFRLYLLERFGEGIEEEVRGELV